MTYELSENEERELKRALALHLDRLQDEIVHTDDRDFAAGLKASYEVLERIGRRLDLVASVPSPGLA